MSRTGNHEAIEELFACLQREFGNMTPLIIQTLVNCVGGIRLTFPDLQDLYRAERNKRIRKEFQGFNHEELGIKYRLHPKQIRRIVATG